MEERRTAELMSDFDDYEIAGTEDDTNGDAGDADESDETESGVKGPRKKKKSR
jgi:hypothetical protein